MLDSSGPFLVSVWIVTALTLVSAVWVVVLRNLFRAALSLGVVLVGVAVLFVLLEAEFLALVQILIYVGAILTLVVFAIMLTANLQTPTSAPASRQQLPAACVAVALFVILAGVVWSRPWQTMRHGDPVSLSVLGRELITTLILPFEVISLVFVAAMVGAIALAATSPRSHISSKPPESRLS